PADASVLQVAVAAHQAVSFIGMPDARSTLAHATVHMATAPKSNAAYVGINEAIADIRAGKGAIVPAHLRDGHYSGAKALGNATGYQYPHDDPGACCASSTCRMTWPKWSTTGPPLTATSVRSTVAWTRCGVLCVGRARASRMPSVVLAFPAAGNPQEAVGPTKAAETTRDRLR